MSIIKINCALKILFHSKLLLNIILYDSIIFFLKLSYLVKTNTPCLTKCINTFSFKLSKS
jgi:hypothetical protein